MIKFSIIIPAYNAEKYLEKCIASLKLDNCLSAEIIIINDGSIDNTFDICVKFSDKYPDNIVYISKENNGVSSARNDGLKAAKGKYIVFLDADDYVSNDFFSSLQSIINEDADLFVYQYNVVNEDDAVIEQKPANKQFLQLDSKICDGLFQLIEYQPWNKIYKRSIIEEQNLRFDESMKWSEDIDFIARYCKHVESIFISDKVLYNYRVNSNGAVASMDNRAIACHHKAFINQMDLLKAKNAEIEAYRTLVQAYVEHQALTIYECYKKDISKSVIIDALKGNNIKEDLVYKPNSLSARFKTMCIKNSWISLLLLYFKSLNLLKVLL